ncbi:hypothetical protein HOV00_gp38 [Microbacterium phage Schubert]|uniref:Uncharacterized protein n=1 Tax=Microbacterium phage Schubert TaxID=2500787 RepID=A0A3T0IP26_9CAUD|nr:hypothetical protein HOV00_gp38 [Microbacterium phage Schubert]AZV01761.1 hypothetical protein SEA_SCHUBERT_55 [Microbacterium phage Schubert]
MNRERQQAVDACALKARDWDMTETERRELRKELRRLLTLEEEAVRKMEPHATKPNTAANYNKALIARDALEKALHHLARRDYGEVAATLDSIKGLSAPRRKLVFEPSRDEPEEWYSE